MNLVGGGGGEKAEEKLEEVDADEERRLTENMELLASYRKNKNTWLDVKCPSMLPYIETPWTIIGAYFNKQHLKRLVRHQIESYNDFVSNQIQRTIDMFNPVVIASEQDFCKKTRKVVSKFKLHSKNLTCIVHKSMKTMVLQKLCFHTMQGHATSHTRPR